MTTISRIRPAAPRRPSSPWTTGEPSLAEVLADPVVHLVMARDGLTPQDVEPFLREAQIRLWRGLCRLEAAA